MKVASTNASSFCFFHACNTLFEGGTNMVDEIYIIIVVDLVSI